MRLWRLRCCSLLMCASCSVLQRVAACCSVLQHFAVCCSVLQCVAMYFCWIPCFILLVVPALYHSCAWQGVLQGVLQHVLQRVLQCVLQCTLRPCHLYSMRGGEVSDPASCCGVSDGFWRFGLPGYQLSTGIGRLECWSTALCFALHFCLMAWVGRRQ